MSSIRFCLHSLLLGALVLASFWTTTTAAFTVRNVAGIHNAFSAVSKQSSRAQAGTDGLPLPNPDIPLAIVANFSVGGRTDVHGWLYLPTDCTTTATTTSATDDVAAAEDAACDQLNGYWYHHTPEFFTDSPHDYMVMLRGSLQVQTSDWLSEFPFPPEHALLGTEYTFTPPEFSLDSLLIGQLPASTWHGHFQNGSFDTPQRYNLSGKAQLSVEGPPLHIHYLNGSTSGVTTYSHLPYISFPRTVYTNNSATTTTTTTTVVHLYWVHLLSATPDFDQVVHVSIDPASCVFAQNGDEVADVLSVAATFLIENTQNAVLDRLSPADQTLIATLKTANGPDAMGQYTQCKVQVLEEIHCVDVPDSFEPCPAVSKR
jgi:hypothetical protein